MAKSHKGSPHNLCVVQKHMGSCDGLTFSEIICRLEHIAYRLAHEGDTAQAMAIFIVVAEMEAVNSINDN